MNIRRIREEDKRLLEAIDTKLTEYKQERPAFRGEFLKYRGHPTIELYLISALDFDNNVVGVQSLYYVKGTGMAYLYFNYADVSAITAVMLDYFFEKCFKVKKGKGILLPNRYLNLQIPSLDLYTTPQLRDICVLGYYKKHFKYTHIYGEQLSKYIVAIRELESVEINDLLKEEVVSEYPKLIRLKPIAARKQGGGLTGNTIDKT